jgi:hypothetical protein
VYFFRSASCRGSSSKANATFDIHSADFVALYALSRATTIGVFGDASSKLRVIVWYISLDNPQSSIKSPSAASRPQAMMIRSRLKLYYVGRTQWEKAHAYSASPVPSHIGRCQVNDGYRGELSVILTNKT